MKAVLHTRYGSPNRLQIHEIEKPTPLDRQVLVRVMAASINASDWRAFENLVLSRLVGGSLMRPKDIRTGSDVAGIVEAVGENVQQLKVGDEVFGCGKGSFAEYVLARDAYLVLKPANITFAQAAAVPIAALTALQAIRYAGESHPGRRWWSRGRRAAWGCSLWSWPNIMGLS